MVTNTPLLFNLVWRYWSTQLEENDMKYKIVRGNKTTSICLYPEMSRESTETHKQKENSMSTSVYEEDQWQVTE